MTKAIYQLLFSTLVIFLLGLWTQGIEVAGLGTALAVAAIRLVGYILGGFTVLIFLPFFIEDRSIRVKWATFFWVFNLSVFFINLFMLGGISAFIEGFDMDPFPSLLLGSLVLTTADLFTHSLGVEIHF
ncbi:hypothetical protein [Laceyella putida]|uniref:Uncharacterized protein n=1 Tax=Laceyella putida TaxID=110101 RepID=A0ABW2RGW5_9BACL